MIPRAAGVALLKRLAVASVTAVVVALLVVGAATVATQDAAEREPVATPEYAPDAIATTPIPADGEVEIDRSTGEGEGIVVVDATHSNRFDRSDVAPLARALASLGYGIRIHDGGQNLHQALSDANAFVVVDPAREFESNEYATVRAFTERGGRLLLVGEPNRMQRLEHVSGEAFAVQESALTTLAAAYDMSLGTAYLYNLETNGGNYKHVLAEPTPESGLAFDRVTTFTAAPVSASGGTVLLRATEHTHVAGLDGTERYPVAVRDGNVLLLGDSSILRTGRHTVGDNEQFVAYVAEFLADGDPGDDGSVGRGDDGDESG